MADEQSGIWDKAAKSVKEKQDRGFYPRSAAAAGREVSILGEGISFPKKTQEELERDAAFYDMYVKAINDPNPPPPPDYIRTQPNTAIPYCYREPHDRDAVIIHVGEGSERCSYITEQVGIYYNKAGEISGGRIDKAQEFLDIVGHICDGDEFELGYLLVMHLLKAKEYNHHEELNDLARKCRDAKLTVRLKPTDSEMETNT